MKQHLVGGGGLAAGFLGAGFAVRALYQWAMGVDAAQVAGLGGLPPLLYCVGFGYALLGLSLDRYPAWLHLGAASLIAGAMLDGLAGKTPIGLALFAVGALVLLLAFQQAASRAGPGFQRTTLLVAATGPGLFAVHAFAFGAGDGLLQARFLRLGATAAMALPLLAAIYRLHPVGGATRPTRWARALFGIGMVAMPLALSLSAFVDVRLKYALGPASDCFTVGLIIVCLQAWRVGDRVALFGFGTLLANMVLGKLLGLFAFDGPLPPPALLTAYADEWRVALRHFHIDIMVLGYAFLLWPSLVRLHTVAVAGLALLLGLCMPAMAGWSPWAAAATMVWLVFFWRGRTVE